MCALSKSWDVRWIVPHKIMYGAPVLEDLNNRPVKQSENIVNLSGTYFGYLDSWSPEANFKKFTEALFLRWLKITRWMCIFRQMQSCLDVTHHQLRSSKCTGFQIHVKDAIELKVANRYKLSTSNIVDEEKTFTGSLVLDSRIDEVTCIHPIVDYLFSRNVSRHIVHFFCRGRPEGQRFQPPKAAQPCAVCFRFFRKLIRPK